MSQQHLEERVDELGRDVAGLKRDVAHQAAAVAQISKGVETLLARDAARPEPMGWRTIIGTLGSVASVIAMMAFFSWWFISTSPTVLDIDRRLTRLDDRDIGRVTRLEKDSAWTARVGK